MEANRRTPVTVATPGPRISRRGLLTAAVAAGAATALGDIETSDAESRALPSPDRCGLDHIIVVMMENRSFDHFLGWLPGADGRQAGLAFADRAGVPHDTYHLTDYQGCGHHDPSHSYGGGRVEYNDGMCDGWLRAGHNDEFSIGYYLGSDLSFFGRAAPYWTVFDRYFCATMGPTCPNRLYQHSAQTDRISNSQSLATMPTIWDRLDDKDISRAYYYVDVPFLALFGTRYQPISRSWPQFLDDAAEGDLPAVSFLDPKFRREREGTSADDHPHADIRAGQSFLNTVYAAVTNGPAWDRTALVINYDEWGGFFDHVPPQTVPDATPQLGTGLRGFRTPAMLISPLARRGYVSHNGYDHTSVLRMIEWRWGLNPLTIRDATARNLAEVLDFSADPDLTAPQYQVPEVDGAPCPSAGFTGAGQYPWDRLASLAQRLGWRVR